MSTFHCLSILILCVMAMTHICMAYVDVGDATCSDQASCTVSDSERARGVNESLGQYLLRKQEQWYNRKSSRRPSNSMQIRMINPNNRHYDVYWYNVHRNPSRIFKGAIKPKSIRSTNSYEGHIFYFTAQGDAPENELWRFEVTAGVNIYIFEPVDDESDDFYVGVKEQKEFLERYQRETGRAWIHHYPRPPPKLFMWSVDEGIGHIHSVSTQQTHWNCIPQDFEDSEQISQCRDAPGTELEFGVEVISQEPRIFVIENVLSSAEVNLVIELAQRKLRRSRAGGDGGMEDSTRTSRTAWLDRDEHTVLDSIYHRVADILQIDDALLHTDKNVESMQVVHYDVGQEYMAHTDFGDHGDITSRYITLLFYLNDMVDDESGGQTLFPKANDDKGIAVHPGKGNAVLFYSLLPDGNGDEKSLHEAVKILKGEKYICNFWVWSPHR